VSFSKARSSSSASEVQIQSFFDHSDDIASAIVADAALAVVPRGGDDRRGGNCKTVPAPRGFRKSTPIALNCMFAVTSDASCAEGGPPFIARYFCSGAIEAAHQDLVELRHASPSDCRVGNDDAVYSWRSSQDFIDLEFESITCSCDETVGRSIELAGK